MSKKSKKAEMKGVLDTFESSNPYAFQELVDFVRGARNEINTKTATLLQREGLVIRDNEKVKKQYLRRQAGLPFEEVGPEIPSEVRTIINERFDF